jgi:integrase
MTFQEAVERWLKETGHKRDSDGDRQRLGVMSPLNGKALETLSQADLDGILQAVPTLKAPGSRNRYRATFRAVLRRAVVWQVLEKAPPIHLEPEPLKDLQVLTREQAARLVQAAPSHVQPVIRFALATGLRKANIMGLRWINVDLHQRMLWVAGEEAKGKRPIGIPLNDTALTVLRGEQGKHREFVFTVEGRPYRWLDHKTWLNLCQRAGMPKGFRFHDLRHTAFTWLAQAGVDTQRLQRLGGWSTTRMVERYTHLNVEDLRDAVKAINLS